MKNTLEEVKNTSIVPQQIEEINDATNEGMLQKNPPVIRYSVTAKSGIKTQWVFKEIKIDNDTDSLDVSSVKDAIAELIAYKISKEIGFPKIPETKLVKIDGKIGSLQAFVDNDVEMDIKEELVYGKNNRTELKNQLDELKIFSFVAGQWDVSLANLIVTLDNTDNKYSLYSIDSANICNKQYVERYGKLPFVRQNYKLQLHKGDEEEFPFESAKFLNQEAIKEISQFSNWPDGILHNLSKKINNTTNKNEFKYVIYKNRLWVQEDTEIKPYVQNLDKTAAANILEKLKSLQDSDQIKKMVAEIVRPELLNEFVALNNDTRNEITNEFNEFVDDFHNRSAMAISGFQSELYIDDIKNII